MQHTTLCVLYTQKRERQKVCVYVRVRVYVSVAYVYGYVIESVRACMDVYMYICMLM